MSTPNPLSQLTGLNYSQSDIVRSIINQTYIIDYGIVKTINSDKTIDVTHAVKSVLINGVDMPVTVTKNIEVLFPASYEFGIKWPMKTGDGVILLGLKDAVAETSGIVEPTNAPGEFLHYCQNTMKAIPLQAVSSPKVSLDVSSGGDLEIKNTNTSGKITIKTTGSGDIETVAGTGKLQLKNGSKSLFTILNNIATHTKSIATNLQSATTIPAVPGTPLTFNPATIALFTTDAGNLATDASDLALLLKA
jgi:hypothetical protein